MEFFKQYKGVRATLDNYWLAYGGWSALIKSPYYHLSIVLTAISFPKWLSCSSSPWYDLPISVIPNMLGFTLGGYAILLAFGDSKFIKSISGNIEEENGEPSPFMVVNANFIHFILLQVVSLVFALIGKAWETTSWILALPGYWCFLYAILATVATAFQIFNLAKWYDIYANHEDETDKSKPD